MPRQETLTSSDNPRVKAVVRLREQRERRKTGLFIAEGSREVERALAAGLKAVEVFWCPAMVELPAAVRGSGAALTEITEPLAAKMSYCENPQGLVAVFHQPAWTLDDLFPAQVSGLRSRDPLFLIAVGTQKPGNLGAMVRSAAAAGVAGVIVADGVVDAFNPNAIRASTGAVFGLPVVGGTTGDVLAALGRAGVRLFAAAPESAGVDASYLNADLTGAVALAIGAEDEGLNEEWMTAARRNGGCVTIPMHGKLVDSLNASVAAGALLFEALRQRMSRPG